MEKLNSNGKRCPRKFILSGIFFISLKLSIVKYNQIQKSNNNNNDIRKIIL